MLIIYTIIYTINITRNTHTDNINNMLLLIYTTISEELYAIAIRVIHTIYIILLILTIC